MTPPPPNTPPPNTPPPNPPPSNSNSAAPNTPAPATTPSKTAPILMASAVVLFVLLVLQVARPGQAPTPEPPADPFAPLASAQAGADRVGDYTLLNIRTNNNDVLVVLDQRSETLNYYQADQKGVQFRGRERIIDLIAAARRANRR